VAARFEAARATDHSRRPLAARQSPPRWSVPPSSPAAVPPSRLLGRPRHQDESAVPARRLRTVRYLWRSRWAPSRGRTAATGSRRLVPHYACPRQPPPAGKAICVNGVALRQDVLDREVLRAIADALQPTILERAVEKALAKLAHAHSHHATRRSQAARELQEVQRKVDRLVDALADGSLPADEIKARLTAERARKTALQVELTKLEQVAPSREPGHRAPQAFAAGARERT
jgi:hypothetical protein